MLELKQLQYKYEDLPEFEFSFKLNHGDSLAIIGPTNSGKTTLLNLIAGFITPTHGELFFNGENIGYAAVKDRPVNILFQENNNFDHLTIFDNIAIGLAANLKLNQVQKELVDYALNKVGLGGFGRRFPHQLTNVQKQKVAVARAFVRDKPILLLDEAFTSLDLPQRLEMLDLIQVIQQERSFILLMVTQNYNDALRICNKTCFLQDGEIVYLGSTKQLAEVSKNPLIKIYATAS